ncbi:MAG TPA: hypothetical protein VLK84_19995 [Longimicrobium sp.]|nr:hypothetical protein [Longimicrobium sp.]
MPSITEGDLTFDFPAGWEVSKLDEWSFYRNQFQNVCNGTKAIDIMAVEPAHACAWFIEIKDYRRHARKKTADVADEIAHKVRDSLALVAVANVNANDDDEKARAGRALRSRKIRVVLHLEQTTRPSKLYPRKIDLANTQQKLRQLVRAIDPHALVCETSVMGGCGWTVQ